jgi:hypothetical protein
LWHNELQRLYGDFKMTYTAHAHIHLPAQVSRFGPLDKTSCFVFKGMLKHLKKHISGPRYIVIKLQTD